MYRNAARVVVLVLCATRGDAALERLRKPTSAVVATSVAQPVAAVAPAGQPAVAAAPVVVQQKAAVAQPVTAVAQPVAAPVAAGQRQRAAVPTVVAAATPTMAKAAVDNEKEVARMAIAATAKTYQAQIAQAASGQVLGASPRAEQAKQMVAQIHAASPKVVTTPSHPALQVGPEWPNMPRLVAEIAEAEDQERNKKKQLKLQAGLEKEKEVEAAKAQKHAAKLREQATKLRKEAELASQIAKEKSDAAALAEQGENATESKAANLVAEQREMQRMLKQTQKEELVLEHNISNLELEKSKVQTAPAVAKAKTSAQEKHTNVLSASPASKFAVASNQEAMQKLVDENNKLKHEKAELERQLQIRKVAKEKAKLKQKLKNRLALADRHMKLQKRMLRSGKHLF